MDFEKSRARLETLARQLRELEDASAESLAVVELDQQSIGRLSRMDAMQQQAMAQATSRSRRTILAKIHAALGRIENETYGDCLRCGDPIADARLEADPTATLCIDCARGD